jgi:hypothetical protein
MPLIRYLSMRDTKSFTMLVIPVDQKHLGGLNSLQLAAEYSESLELLKNLMQIDQSMVQRNDENNNIIPITALGFLCGRSQFRTFNEMYKCLIAAESSVKVVLDSFKSCFRFYGRSNCTDSKVVLALIELLLEANSSLLNVLNIQNGEGNIFHWVCLHLKGELNTTVIHSFPLSAMIRYKFG